jgi:ABC-type sugar transport system permease subunit
LQFFSLTEIYSNRSQTIEPVCLQSVLTVMILHRVIVMTIYMLNIISDIFLGVKSLVFNFPPAPAHSKHSLGVSFCNPHICYEQIFSFFSFIAGLQTIDKTLYEAGAVDGVKNRWQELWYITLPCMKPQLMFGAVMQITQSFAISDVSINLAGNPSVNYAGATIVTHLIDLGSIRYEMGYSSAIATILFLLMIATNKLAQKALKKVGT